MAKVIVKKKSKNEIRECCFFFTILTVILKTDAEVQEHVMQLL